MNIKERANEIDLCQAMLGEYTGMLGQMYLDKQIDADKYKEELNFIKGELIKLKGADDEDVLITDVLINSL